MINMMDQDTRTERKQVFDTQLSRRRNRLFSSLSSSSKEIVKAFHDTLC